MQMLEQSIAHCRDDGCAGIAGRPGYEEVALRYKWNFATGLGHREDILDEVKGLVRNGPTKGIREKAAWELGFYYGFRDYEKAVPLFSALATGDIHGQWSESALQRLKELAERSGNPKYRQRYIKTARQIISRYGDVMPPRTRERIETALKKAKEQQS